MSKMAGLWFCSMIFYKFLQVSPRCPKWLVFDFVAWIFTSFTSQSKMSKMAGLWFCSMKFYNLHSASDISLQNQNP